MAYQTTRVSEEKTKRKYQPEVTTRWYHTHLLYKISCVSVKYATPLAWKHDEKGNKNKKNKARRNWGGGPSRWGVGRVGGATARLM